MFEDSGTEPGYQVDYTFSQWPQYVQNEVVITESSLQAMDNTDQFRQTEPQRPKPTIQTATSTQPITDPNVTNLFQLMQQQLSLQQQLMTQYQIQMAQHDQQMSEQSQLISQQNQQISTQQQQTSELVSALSNVKTVRPPPLLPITGGSRIDNDLQRFEQHMTSYGIAHTRWASELRILLKDDALSTFLAIYTDRATQETRSH